MITLLLAVLLTSLTQHNPPTFPLAEVFLVHQDMEEFIYVESDYVIKNITIVNAVNSYSHFVTYSGDRKSAQVVFYEDKSPLIVDIVLGMEMPHLYYECKIYSKREMKFRLHR